MTTLQFIPTHQLLQTPATTAHFGGACADFCRSRGWATVNDIVQVPLIQLLVIPGYLQHCHHELVDFLAAHYRLNLLDTGPSAAPAHP